MSGRAGRASSSSTRADDLRRSSRLTFLFARRTDSSRRDRRGDDKLAACRHGKAKRRVRVARGVWNWLERLEKAGGRDAFWFLCLVQWGDRLVRTVPRLGTQY